MKFHRIFLAALILTGLVGASTQHHASSTEAAFNDLETSSDNIMSAGTWDIDETLSKIQKTDNSSNENTTDTTDIGKTSDYNTNDTKLGENDSKSNEESEISIIETVDDLHEEEEKAEEVSEEKKEKNESISDNSTKNYENHTAKNNSANRPDPSEVGQRNRIDSSKDIDNKSKVPINRSNTERINKINHSSSKNTEKPKSNISTTNTVFNNTNISETALNQPFNDKEVDIEQNRSEEEDFGKHRNKSENPLNSSFIENHSNSPRNKTEYEEDNSSSRNDTKDVQENLTSSNVSDKNSKLPKPAINSRNDRKVENRSKSGNLNFGDSVAEKHNGLDKPKKPKD